eukprot:Phypoly_transcript_15733.p2 GENE.Phypoly_transcript_15733~~Phypoly_transcript_15733.p2  ORF type:complete len:160 (+),score=31.83 Phypoly_transcript_15733:378-857(+)
MTTLHECLKTLLADTENVTLDTEAEILLYNFVSFISTRGTKGNKENTYPTPISSETSSQNEDDSDEEPTRKTKGTPIKRKKDPNAPKRPLTAFMLYAHDKRAEIKAQNPDMTFGALGKKLGETWLTFDATQKKVYSDMADKAKLTYEKELAEYTKNKQT